MKPADIIPKQLKEMIVKRRIIPAAKKFAPWKLIPNRNLPRSR